MKKNKMMRVASVLLVAVLLTISAVSGTFAKYVTSDSGSDTARVAKFGVVASVSGDLFGAQYNAVGAGNGITTWTVATAGTVNGGEASEMVVAPGTVGGTMSFSVTGTPEVSTTATFGLPLDKAGADTNFEDTDIVLKAGEYGIMKPVTVTLTDENKGQYYKLAADGYTFSVNDATTTTQVYELVNGVNNTADYLPIKWSTDGSDFSIANVAAARTALTTALGLEVHTPNVAWTNTASLTWKWAFDDGTTTAISETDKKDTILGDLIALGTGTNIGGSYVVVKSGDNYIALKLGTETNAAPSDGSLPAQVITFAYKASDNVTEWNGTGVVAVLTESFGASLTIVQVD